MVDSARKLLLAECALDPDHFFADAFEPSVSLVDALQSKQKNRVHLRHTDGTEQTLTLPGDIKLMNALRDEGLMQGICGGQKSCGSCRIEIDPAWAAHLPPAERGEARLLATLNDPQPQDRLACQISLTPALDGLRITIPNRHV
ncbi:MAG: 2Fe-2S iron-sulfur cluster-binding protein [Candidatus Nitrotoga sp.]